MTHWAEGRALVVERLFNAPRELVFNAFKKPEHLAKWWGPKGWTLPVCSIDFRPGGVWHYCMRTTDGQMESWGKAIYSEIVEPEKIVYIDFFSDANGGRNEDLPTTQITMTFTEHGGATKIVSRAEYASEEALRTVLDMGLVHGLTESYERLADLLEQIQ